MSQIDWSKAGKRIRFQPKDRWGKSLDWNLTAQRWKDEADYWADDLESETQLVALAACPHCHAHKGMECVGRGLLPGEWHTPRKRAAGEALLAERGPRFS